MNGEQIATLILSDHAARRTFAGVFARDEIPKLPRDARRYPLSFVVNTERLHEDGEHWVAVYYTSPNGGEFFDSFGRSPVTLGFTRTRLPGISRWNKIKLQSARSGVCGQYCVYFIVTRARGQSSATNVFSPNRGFHWNTPERNDANVEKYCMNYS
jgi:hypothetical protein